jgi:hypothetical protein
MELAKVDQILFGIVFLAGSFMFVLISLCLTLLPGGYILNSLPEWVLLGAFFIFFIEAVAWWLKGTLAMDEAKLEQKSATLWSQLGRFRQYLDAFRVVITSILLLIIFGVAFYYIFNSLKSGMVFRIQFFVLLATYVFYLVVRSPLLSFLEKLFAPASKMFRGNLPSYTLNGSGLTIDLNIRNLWGPSEKYLVNINFDELDEIRTFTFQEASTFLRYKIGPNAELLAKQAKGMYSYMKHEIPRPSTYIVHATSSIGKIVLLRGPELLYFVAFDKDDVSDLLDAFEKYKKKAGK